MNELAIVALSTLLVLWLLGCLTLVREQDGWYFVVIVWRFSAVFRWKV